MVRRCEWSCESSGKNSLRIFMRPPGRSAQRNPPAAHLHAQFPNQRKHGQMNSKTGGRFCNPKSRGPLSALSCDQEWGRGAKLKPPKNIWGPAAAAHLDPHLLMNTNMPMGNFTCQRGIAAIAYLQLAERACFSWAISSSERGLSSSIYMYIPLPASCNVSTRARKE